MTTFGGMDGTDMPQQQQQTLQESLGAENQDVQTKVIEFNTQHEDNINDCQFDFYGAQLASCDSNGFLQISTLKNEGQDQPVTFKAHKGPIWQVAWAHPKYESVIATCGYDGYVVVWKRDNNGKWQNPVFQADLGSSVNCIAWAPWEYGLILAAGTAEGKIVIFRPSQQKDQTAGWDKIHEFVAHTEGVNGISWGPSTEPAILAGGQGQDGQQAAGGKFQPPPKRLVSGGNDHQVMLWQLNEDGQQVKTELGAHGDWVRDVAWCNNIGLMHEMIASCSEDQTCKVWKNNGQNKETPWTCEEIDFPEKVPLWKVSWSQVGNMLAISGGDNQVHVMAEEATGEWKQIQVVDAESAAQENQPVNAQQIE